MSTFFNFDSAHSGNNPPKGIIKGKLIGDAYTKYDIQILTVNNNEYSERETVETDSEGAATVSLKIISCNPGVRYLRAQVRKPPVGKWVRKTAEYVRVAC
jgi:hypothetical protein